MDKADARPVIIAAQKALANDADQLQKVMDIALPYYDEYDALNQAMITALAGVTEWRSSPTNPGPACRDCEAKHQSLHQKRAELCGRTLIKLKAALPENVWLGLRAGGGLPVGAF